MRTKFSLAPTFFVACVAAIAGAHAAVTVTSTDFAFTGNWPANQPVAAGSTVTNIPFNIAAAAADSTPFAIGEYGGPHLIANLNDGRYGNAYSWITASLTLSRNVVLGGAYGTVNMSFAGVALSNATLFTLSDIVIGRSAAYEYTDRFAGNIYLQITTAGSVADIIRTDAAADSQWTTLGFFTTTDPYEHMFSFTSPVQATGVRIVTAAGNCIDEIVVHGVPVSAPAWGAGGFVWANVTGGAWSVGANWTNGLSPNSIYDNVYMTAAPLSDKAVLNDTAHGLLDGRGYQYGTLNVDATLGDASPVVFSGDPFYLWLSDINVSGHLIMSNAVESYSEVRLNAFGEVALSEWTPTLITQPKLHVSSGTLTVAGTVPAGERTLPSGAWMHLDASRTNTMVLADAGGGTFYVQQWNDVTGNGTFAVAEAPVNRPVWRVEDGIPHVDFGFLTFGSAGGIMNGKTLTWSAPNTLIRTALLVYSDVPGDPYVQSILCTKSVTTSVNFCRDGVLFNKVIASPFVTGGTISLDGARVDGTDKLGQFNAYLSSGFHVISVTTTGDAAADCFARDHMGHAGGQRLAEVVLYNRALTAPERKAAEAYLMNKWLANPLPADAGAGAGQAAALTLDNNTALNAASDVRTLSLTVNGNATKSGPGRLTAAQIKQMNGTFTLSGGMLAVTGDMLSENEHVTAIPAPWAHLDASAYATSMSTETAEDGTISVKSWSDVTGNGFSSSSPEGSTAPTLVTNGLNGLPFVDFGSLTLASATGGNLVWNTTNSLIRTVVMVYSDSTNYYYHTDGRDLRSCFLGNTYSSLDFWRGNEGALAYQNAASGVKYGHFAVDGEAATMDTYLPVGFHVLSFVTAANTHSEAFARSKADWSGGQRLAEVLIWNLPLTSPQLRSIEQQLMVKWLARNAPGYPARTATGPAADPWMHLDAADTNSMELVDDGGSLYVQQWNDVRTNGVHAVATESSFRPVWQPGNGFPYVDFGILSGPVVNTAMGQHLCWSETNTNVRAVFLVYSDADSGLAQNFIGSLVSWLPFNRGLDRNFFHPLNASSYVVQGTHSLDYGRVNGCTTPLPSGFHVVGISTYHGRAVKADVFARDRDGHAGGQKLAEVLVYNRELTDGEFRQTRRYLMRKWFGARSDQESDLSHLAGATDTTLDIGAGQTLTCRNQSCPGNLEKRGPGRLIIASGSAGSLSLPDGELWLEKPFTAAGGAALSTVSLGTNATINLRRNAFSVQTLAGAGTLSNGTVTAGAVTPGTVGGVPQTLTVGGDLVLSDACVINIDAAAAAADQVLVTGTLSLPANGTVVVSFSQGTLLAGTQRLFTFGGLSGAQNLTSWSVAIVPSGIYTASLVLSENAIDIVYHPQGTLFLLR